MFGGLNTNPLWLLSAKNYETVDMCWSWQMKKWSIFKETVWSHQHLMSGWTYLHTFWCCSANTCGCF